MNIFVIHKQGGETADVDRLLPGTRCGNGLLAQPAHQRLGELPSIPKTGDFGAVIPVRPSGDVHGEAASPARFQQRPQLVARSGTALPGPERHPDFSLRSLESSGGLNQKSGSAQVDVGGQ